MVADNDEWRMLSCSGGAGNGESDVSLFRQKSCGYLTWLAFSAVVLKSCQDLADNYSGRGGRPGIVNQRVALSLEMAVDYLECEALCRTVAGLYIRSNPAYQVC